MVCKLKSILRFLIFFIVLSICFFYVYKFYLKVSYPIKYSEYVSESCEKYGVEKELAFAVMRTESNFNEDANSRAGAIGLMQIMPETFEWLQSNLREKNIKDKEQLKDPKVNIDYGIYLLSLLKNKYTNEAVALCAYNAGIGAVDRWLNDSSLSDDKRTLKKIPYDETRNYVLKVLNSKKKYKNLYFKN